MNRRFALSVTFAAASIVLFVGAALGRLIPDWPYEKLFKNSDLVVIAKAVSTRDANKADKLSPPQGRQYLIGVVTTLRVIHVVKGEHKAENLELLHFRLKQGVHIINGPSLVTFCTERQALRGDGWSASIQPEYMLFLKKSNDGRYECVSGQFDPELSVKQILDPLPRCDK